MVVLPQYVDCKSRTISGVAGTPNVGMSDVLAAQHAGEFHEVAGLAAGAGTDIRAVQFHVHVLRLLALARIRMTRDSRFELAQIHDMFINKFLVS